MPEITTCGIGSAGDQVFRGKEDAEVVEKLAKAQDHATKLIRKQAKIEQLQELLTNTLARIVTEKLVTDGNASQ